VTTRADLARILSADASVPTKTFIVEAHPEQDSMLLLQELAENPDCLERTNDAFLFRLRVPGEDAGEDNCFWVDQLDERFWSFHTNMPVTPASRYLKKRISSRSDLDWVWLPSEHLRMVWPGVPTRGIRSKFEGQSLGGSGPLEDVRLKIAGRSVEFFLQYLSQNPEIRSAVPFDGIEIALDDPALGTINEAVDRMGRFAVSGNSLEFHVQFVETVVRR